MSDTKPKFCCPPKREGGFFAKNGFSDSATEFESAFTDRKGLSGVEADVSSDSGSFWVGCTDSWTENRLGALLPKRLSAFDWLSMLGKVAGWLSLANSWSPEANTLELLVLPTRNGLGGGKPS